MVELGSQISAGLDLFTLVCRNDKSLPHYPRVVMDHGAKAASNCQSVFMTSNAAAKTSTHMTSKNYDTCGQYPMARSSGGWFLLVPSFDGNGTHMDTP